MNNLGIDTPEIFYYIYSNSINEVNCPHLRSDYFAMVEHFQGKRNELPNRDRSGQYTIGNAIGLSETSSLNIRNRRYS